MSEGRPNILKDPLFTDQTSLASNAAQAVLAVAILEGAAREIRDKINLSQLQGECERVRRATEFDVEMTYPSERTPEQQRAAVAYERAKKISRLTIAAWDFVKVWEEVSTK